MATDSINSRIEVLSKELESLSAEYLDDAARKKLFGIVSQATAALESPIDTIWRMIMSVSLVVFLV